MVKEQGSAKTIRFRETVDIREIPHDDCESRMVPDEAGAQPGQNTTITCPKFFKTQQNVIICIVIICVIVGTVGRIVLSKEEKPPQGKSLTYDEICKDGSNECNVSQHLLCHNSRCQCDDSTRYWDATVQTCAPRLNYSQRCRATSDCASTFLCSNSSGLCTCDDSQYYDVLRSQCVNRASICESCTASINHTCLRSLYCDEGTCVCPIGKKWLASKLICIAIK